MVVLKYLSFAIGVVGIVVIVFGAFLSLISFVRLEVRHAGGENICRKRELMRHHLGSYILLGLEFLIAADVVHTLLKPSLQEMAVLGSIVVIRTILSFFLNRELANHPCPSVKSNGKSQDGS